MAPVPPAGMRAPPAPVHHDLLLTLVHQRHQPRHGEEDAVHDAEREARLEHGARLVDAEAHRRQRAAAKRAQVDVDRRVARDDGDAVRVGDEAQLVDAGDEGADEGEVDEPDEARVVAVREDGEQRPREREHRHDEQDQNVVGREQVGLDIAVHEEGEHAHDGDLVRGGGVISIAVLAAGGRKGRLTRVMICMKRQLANRMPKIMVATGRDSHAGYGCCDDQVSATGAARREAAAAQKAMVDDEAGAGASKKMIRLGQWYAGKRTSTVPFEQVELDAAQTRKKGQ